MSDLKDFEFINQPDMQPQAPSCAHCNWKDRAVAAERELAELQERTRWRKYPDETPAEGYYDTCATVNGKVYYYGHAYYHADKGRFAVAYTVTYYCALPVPPEAENE